MKTVELQAALEGAIADVRLLEHRFYQRWECGHLTRNELTDYASQYRHFEAALPGILHDIVAGLPEGGSARKFVQDNLDDEAGANGKPSHLELFDSFLTAVDGDRTASPSPAMTNLLDAYRQVASQGTASALGGLAAYEMQSSSVAESKGEGLRKHYGLGNDETRFWDLHATLDVEHSKWAIEATAEIADNVDDVVKGTRKIAQAWWEFLDERETLAAKA